MIKSRISSKAQTVLPRAVRQHLGVEPGDDLVYEITAAGEVVLRASRKAVLEDPFALFGEWSSAADEEAYADLPVAKCE